MTFKIRTAAAAAFLALVAAPVLAQQGTTPAGPAKGQKSDGSALTTPSVVSGAKGGAMMKSDSGCRSRAVR